MANNSKVVYSISTESVIKIIVILAAVGFLWLIRDIIALLFVALILASAFDPMVDYLQKYRIPRLVSIIFIYIAFISLISSVIILLSGPIAVEVKNIARDIPQYYREINDNITRFQNSATFLGEDRLNSLRGDLDTFISNLTYFASGNVLPVISTIFGGLVSMILILVLTFYLVVQEEVVKRFIVWILPNSRHERIWDLIEKIERKMGLWLRGQFLLSFIIFCLTYIGLKVLGVNYALVLALLAGIFEVVPFLGPILGAIPAIFLTLTLQGTTPAIFVFALYLVIQQLENHFIVPKVMSKSVGLNSLVVILSILVGAKVAGVLGALMAVPVAAAITVYLEDRVQLKQTGV